MRIEECLIRRWAIAWSSVGIRTVCAKAFGMWWGGTHPTGQLARSIRFRSCGSSQRFLSRTIFGVTSTSSSSFT
jgi:hypothetical protein